MNNTSKQNDTIEAVQNNFLQFMSFTFNMKRPPHGSYENILNYLNLILLKSSQAHLEVSP